MGYENVSSRGSSELLVICNCIYCMLVASTCYLFNKLTSARNQSNSFNFLLNYNTSLSSSCLIFRKIKRDLLQIFGVGLHVPLPRCTRHARMYKALLISLMPRLGEQIFSLNSRDIQCFKTCWFDGMRRNCDFVPSYKLPHTQGHGTEDIKWYKRCTAWMSQEMGWDGKT